MIGERKDWAALGLPERSDAERAYRGRLFKFLHCPPVVAAFFREKAQKPLNKAGMIPLGRELVERSRRRSDNVE